MHFFKAALASDCYQFQMHMIPAGECYIYFFCIHWPKNRCTNMTHKLYHLPFCLWQFFNLHVRLLWAMQATVKTWC